MISRESFIVLVDSVIEQINREIALSRMIQEFFDGDIVSKISSNLIERIIGVLRYELNDDDNEYESFIEWWLFDAPEAGKNEKYAYIETIEGKINLRTPGELYDFLVEESNEC